MQTQDSGYEYSGTGGNDIYTGRRKSVEAYRNARNASMFFGMMTRYKEWKIEEMRRRGLDPNNVEDMKKINIGDYKGKWYQFKRNAEQSILQGGSNAPR